MNCEQEENRQLIEKSIDYWIELEGNLRGYSYSGGASMYASIGRKDVVFDDLLAEGVFKVSAVMKNGEIIYIRIHSLAREPCCLKADLIGEYNAEKSNEKKYIVKDIDEMKVDIKKGETIVFYKKGQDINDMIKPVSNQYGRSNYYGLKK